MDKSESSLPDILYIMGAGRSGTTILDILLANNSEIVGCGELNYIFREGFSQNNPCSCGLPSNDCNFWGEVRKQAAFDPYRFLDTFKLFISIEWHLGYFLLLLGLISRKKLENYRIANIKLLSSIKKVSGVSTIVDSSKLSGRALALAKFFPKKIKIICITRSPKGVMYSFQKKGLEQNPKGPLATFLYYIIVLFSCRLFSLYPMTNTIYIKYEDLMNDPLSCLSELEKWSGLDFSISKSKLLNDEFFESGHIVRGNRLRKNGQVKFKGRQEEIILGSRYQKLLVYFMELFQKLLRLN